MACDYVSRLPEGAVLAAIDGAGDQAIREHIDQCVDCAAEVEQLRRASSLLSVRLFRAACPSSLDLGEYSLKLLPAERAASVASHVAACPHCTLELRQLHAFLAQPEPPAKPSPVEALFQPVRVLVAELARGLNALGQPAPAFAALRGQSSAPVAYQADGHRVLIEIAQDDDQPGRRMLTGLLTTPANGQARAYLWRQGSLLQTHPIDDLGNFEMSGLEPGHYELILAAGDFEVHIQSLPIA
jgi:hypothetical protein